MYSRYKSKVRENKQEQERLSHIAVKIEIARLISFLSIQQIWTYYASLV